MKILAVSDETIDRLYNVGVRETYPDVNLLFGCGDLSYAYLEFLVTIFNVPLYYVPGNHDPEYSSDPNSRVEGGINLDGRVEKIKDLVVAGLGGSILYHPGGPNQYSQLEMYRKVYRLLPKFFYNKLKYRHGLDILITHSPPFGIHDDTDPTHQGLRAINFLLKVAKPRYMFHGHTIFYKHNITSHTTCYYETQVTNIYPFRFMDIKV